MYDDATGKLIRSCLKRKSAMYAAFPDLSLSDLVQEGKVQVEAARSRFNPRQSKWSTFVNTVIFYWLHTLVRARTSERRRIAKSGQRPGNRDGDTASLAGDVFDRAVNLGGDEAKAQDVAIAAVGQRTGYDGRRLWLELVADPELCRACGMGETPGPERVSRALELIPG